MIILWAILIIIFILFGLIVLVGAPYVPTRQADIEQIFTKIKLRKGSRVVDLGSGDGRVLLAASRHGYRAQGYELNPILALIANLRLRRYPASAVNIASYWGADLTKADLVFVFTAQPYLERLSKKLHRELKPGALVVSYGFSFHSKKIAYKIGPANVYKF